MSLPVSQVKIPTLPKAPQRKLFHKKVTHIYIKKTSLHSK